MSGAVPPTEPVPTTPQPRTGTAQPLGTAPAGPRPAAGPGPGVPPARRRGPLVAALVVAVVLLLGSVGATVAWAGAGLVGERDGVGTWDGLSGMDRGPDRAGQSCQGVHPGEGPGGWQGMGPGGWQGVGPGTGQRRPGTGPGMHRGLVPAPALSPSGTPSS